MFIRKEIEQLYNDLTNEVFTPTSLDRQSKELIALACSVLVDCIPCIKYHYKQAATAGASRDKIAEALAISMTISAGSKKAKYSPVIEDLSSECF